MRRTPFTVELLFLCAIVGLALTFEIDTRIVNSGGDIIDSHYETAAGLLHENQNFPVIPPIPQSQQGSSGHNQRFPANNQPQHAIDRPQAHADSQSHNSAIPNGNQQHTTLQNTGARVPIGGTRDPTTTTTTTTTTTKTTTATTPARTTARPQPNTLPSAVSRRPIAGDPSTVADARPIIQNGDDQKRHSSCNNIPGPGECQAAFPRYYYNKTIDQCDCYLYGGCDEEIGSYRTLKECNELCLPALKNQGPTCSIIFIDIIDFFPPNKQTTVNVPGPIVHPSPPVDHKATPSASAVNTPGSIAHQSPQIDGPQGQSNTVPEFSNSDVFPIPIFSSLTSSKNQKPEIMIDLPKESHTDIPNDKPIASSSHKSTTNSVILTVSTFFFLLFH